MNRWKIWASVLIFFAFVMGSATGDTPAEAAQHQMAAAGATVALVLLLAAVGCREVWRRTRHVTGQDRNGWVCPRCSSALPGSPKSGWSPEQAASILGLSPTVAAATLEAR